MSPLLSVPVLLSCVARQGVPVAAPAAGPAVGGPAEVPAEVPAQALFLARPAEARWTWPAPAQFEARYGRAADDRVRQAVVARVLFARADELSPGQLAQAASLSAEEAWEALLPAARRIVETGEWGDTLVAPGPVELVGARSPTGGLDPLFADVDLWVVQQLLAGREDLVLDGSGDAVAVYEDGVLVVDALDLAPAASPPDWAWEARTYTSTLLSFEGPVYPPADEWGAQASPEAEALWQRIEQSPEPADLAALLAVGLPSHDWRWDRAIALAREAGRDDLALEMYGRFRPVGRCSMDSAPQAIASDYARLCYEAGRLGCFLQLQVRIMGQRFDRVAWSSYGDAAHDSHVGALDSVGIDTRSFLLGLMLDFREGEARAIDIGLWRLGRAIAEWQGGPALLDELEALAQDPALDDLNRTWAALTWVFARQQSGEDREALLAELETWELAPATLAWLEWAG